MIFSATRSPEKSQAVSPVILNVNKKILNRESIFRKMEPTQSHRLQGCKNFGNKLTDQQIKTSSIYCKLQERISNLQRNTKLHCQSYENMASTLNAKIKNQKESVHQAKLSIWELKNQLLQLEQELQYQQTNWQNGKMFRSDQQEDYEQGNNYEEEYEQQQENSQNYPSSTQSGNQPELSHPTCSINQFLTGQSQADFSSNIIYTNKSANIQQVPYSLQQIVQQQFDQESQNEFQK